MCRGWEGCGGLGWVDAVRWAELMRRMAGQCSGENWCPRGRNNIQCTLSLKELLSGLDGLYGDVCAVVTFKLSIRDRGWRPNQDKRVSCIKASHLGGGSFSCGSRRAERVSWRFTWLNTRTITALGGNRNSGIYA